ncbi:PH domain-containing protein [Gayadomonas joobiniege]|uniref:PH domain-containing protein n=1 Tax=Gayadomonas joobiniege TaxID=1234606 RepID=UPI00037E21CE|nr:PH domain-containing protein [Gayadomonas joobiniege]
MGLFDAILGNASEANVEEVAAELAPILADDETLVYAAKEIRDMYVFTDRRLLLIDKQGVTGKKVEYHSIPYRAISHFIIETTGHFDLDAELKIWISGSDEAIEKELKGGETTVAIQKALANYALKK